MGNTKVGGKKSEVLNALAQRYRSGAKCVVTADDKEWGGKECEVVKLTRGGLVLVRLVADPKKTELFAPSFVRLASDSLLLALGSFISTINNTGGVLRFENGLHAPVGDPEWIDLGCAYMDACAALGITPTVREGGSG